MQKSLSIAFQTDKPLTAYGPLAAQVEAYGFDGVTVYNDMLYQPAWLPLLEIARATERVRIGPAAVNPFTCHPVNMAGNIALIDEASRGRAYLGIARGSWLDFVGIQPKRAVTALCESFAAVRHLLGQSKDPLAGEIFPVAGGDALRWSILRPDVPFLLGTWGEQTLAACLPFISEVKIGGSANPRVAPWMRRLIGKHAIAAGRAANEIGIVLGAVTVVDEDGRVARKRAAREVALYLPVVAELDPTLEVEADRLEKIKEAAARYDYERAADLVSDPLLAKFAFAGTPEEIAEQTIAILRAGASRVEFGTPHGLTTENGLRLLGERVLPLVRRGVE
ncbi:MAG: LLM class flavin-dependent oxidoreductase [Caldilineaceae bacterium]|nr:LLM class flavin-dependent oxidoreductase [Caldilineaceae bacterium]